MKKLNQLFTADPIVTMSNVLQDYPRPLCQRKSYINLNGEWYFKISKDGVNKILEDIQNDAIDYDRRIIVPFPVESFCSHVHYQPKNDEILIYKKEIELRNNPIKAKSFTLHFGAIDQKAIVLWNKEIIARHEGGYHGFSVELPLEKNQGDNILIVIAIDNLDLTFPVGKQSEKPGGIWYTKSSGIWKTVWLEYLNEVYVKGIKLSPDLDKKKVTVDLTFNQEKTPKITALVSLNNKVFKKVETTDPHFVIPFDTVEEWSPESPTLYKLEIKTDDDTINSYFAFRKITIENVNNKQVLCLNHKPYFFHGLLDQGFYPDGLYTPATYQVVQKDLSRIKELGFNTLRKHIKVEDELWYYYCDKMGIIVFQDLVNNGEYNFFSDSVFPTLGLKTNNIVKKLKKKVKNVETPKEQMEEFKKEAWETFDSLYSHPCVCYYTIFNEGWGQFEDEEFIQKIKEHDPSRIYDVASGWFHTDVAQKWTDVQSEHIYFKQVKFDNIKTDKPLVLSEFGGYSYKVLYHFYSSKQYGYGTCKTKPELNRKIEALYMNEIVPAIKQGLCASIYTQVSDVEEETNGIFTYDRHEQKLDKDVALRIKEKIDETWKDLYFKEEVAINSDTISNTMNEQVEHDENINHEEIDSNESSEENATNEGTETIESINSNESPNSIEFGEETIEANTDEEVKENNESKVDE